MSHLRLLTFWGIEIPTSLVLQRVLYILNHLVLDFCLSSMDTASLADLANVKSICIVRTEIQLH
jgi:hypothetical protein